MSPPARSRRFLLALVLLAAAAGTGAAGSNPAPEAQRLEKALRGVNGLRARFVQIRDVALTGESVEAQGLLAFRPPQRFRLAYTVPERQELVIQGDSLWVIMPSENQAQRYPFSLNAPGSEIFLLFGGHERSLTDVFHVVQEPWGTYPVALRLEPRDPEPGYPLEEIRLVVGEDGFPRRLFFREATGDNVVFEFGAVEKNPPDLEKDLRLRIPPGMEIIDAVPPRTELPIDKR